jgi:hypothetical protein
LFLEHGNLVRRSSVAADLDLSMTLLYTDAYCDEYLCSMIFCRRIFRYIVSGKIADLYIHIINYIRVKSVDEYSSKVENLGGKVIAPKHAVPGMGYFVLCIDTEKNAFAIWETNKKAK